MLCRNCGCNEWEHIYRLVSGERFCLTGGLMFAADYYTQAAQAAEVRITDATTGGQKGQKLARFSLIPSEMLWALAEAYGSGARKYEDRNWERGYKWSLSLDALQRHLNQWLQGETNDTETGANHLISVVWHATALFIFQLRRLGTDDIRLTSTHKAP